MNGLLVAPWKPKNGRLRWIVMVDDPSTITRDALPVPPNRGVRPTGVSLSTWNRFQRLDYRG